MKVQSKFSVKIFTKVFFKDFLGCHTIFEHDPSSNKAKLFAKSFSGNSNFDDSGISLPVFSSRTNLKQHDIY